MKKLLVLLISLFLLLSLVGCSSKKEVVEEKVKEDLPKTEEVIKEEELEEPQIEETIEIEEELVDVTPLKDVTSLSYWVVFYDQYGNELQRTIEKYGTVPEYKTNLPSGFEKWVYKNTKEDVGNSFKSITTNTYFEAVCHEVKKHHSGGSTPTPSIDEEITVGDVIKLGRSGENKIDARVLNIDGNNFTIFPIRYVGEVYPAGAYLASDTTLAQFTKIDSSSPGPSKLTCTSYEYSNFKTKIDAELDNFLGQFNGMENAIITQNVKHYYFLQIASQLNDLNSDPNTFYLLDDRGDIECSFIKKASLEIQNLKSRPLSLNDIFVCLQNLDVSINSVNIKKLLTNDSTQGTTDLTYLTLMDVFSDMGMGNCYYFVYQSTGVIASRSNNVNLPDNYYMVPVYTFDSTVYTDFEFVSHY